MTRTSVHSPSSTPTARPARPHPDGRLAGLALVSGCVLATISALGISFAVAETGEARYTDPLWQPLYGILLAGSLLVVLGLPAILTVHGHASRRLTLIGYVGLFAPLTMLNVAETSMEAFVKPYLAAHGGIPQQETTGLTTFEAVALVLLIVGGVCLATAVFRARVAPLWVGVALLASIVTAFVLPHDNALMFVSDYCVYAALSWFGVRAARRTAVTVSG